MPRRNNGLEQFERLTSLKKYTVTASGFDQTVTAAIDAGDSTATVAASTAATAGDNVLLIGSGGVERNKLGTPATSMPLVYKAAFNHAAGGRLVEVTETDLGHIGQGGVQFGATLQLNPVNAATSRTPIAYVRGQGEMSATWSLLGFNAPNLAAFFGMDDTEDGTGTSSDPYQIGVSTDTLGTHGITSFCATGVATDGVTILTLDLLGVTMTPNGNATLGGGNVAELPMSIRYTNLVLREVRG